MKTLVLYESKKGCTKKCAEYLKKTEESIVSLIRDFNGDITEYENIVLLTPIYIGKIHKNMQLFLNENHDVLLSKHLTIVIVGMNLDGYDVMIDTNFHKDIQLHADIIYGGGAYYLDKLNFIERFIVKKIAKITKSTEDIKYENLDKIKI